MPELGIIAVTLTAFSLLVAAVRTSAAPAVTRRNTQVVTAVVLTWLVATAVLGSTGYTTDFTGRPPNFARLLVAAVLFTLAFASSGWARGLILSVPLWALIAAQSLRIPVELVLWDLFRHGRIPIQMTFEGRNLDILTGVFALGVAWTVRRRPAPQLVLVWNVLGLLLLVTIVAIANLSAPTPARLFTEGPSSAAIMAFPFIWLPTCIVPLALLGHLLVFRRLWSQRTTVIQ